MPYKRSHTKRILAVTVLCSKCVLRNAMPWRTKHIRTEPLMWHIVAVLCSKCVFKHLLKAWPDQAFHVPDCKVITNAKWLPNMRVCTAHNTYRNFLKFHATHVVVSWILVQCMWMLSWGYVRVCRSSSRWSRTNTSAASSVPSSGSQHDRHVNSQIQVKVFIVRAISKNDFWGYLKEHEMSYVCAWTSLEIRQWIILLIMISRVSQWPGHSEPGIAYTMLLVMLGFLVMRSTEMLFPKQLSDSDSPVIVTVKDPTQTHANTIFTSHCNSPWSSP